MNDKAGRFGGTEEYIVTLATALRPLGVSSSLIYGEGHGELPRELAEYHHVPGLAARSGRPETARAVLDLVNRLDPDVVYVHNIFDARILGLLDAPGRRYRILWYVHDHFPSCLTELRARRHEPQVVCSRLLSLDCAQEVREGRCALRFADRSYGEEDVFARWELLGAARHVDALVVISEYMGRLLRSHLPELAQLVRVLPRQIRGGFPDSAVYERRKAPAVPGQRAPRLRLAFCGRLAPEKGLDVALDALARLPAHLQADFVVAGVVENEPYWRSCQSHMQRLSRERPELRLEYRGPLPYQEVDRLYRESDVVLVPSVWGEPAGAVAAEAMRNGAAVIAADVGGLSTWVRDGETGLLVPPRDPVALARAITLLQREPPLRRRLAEAGRRLVSEHFTVEAHLQALWPLLMPHSPSPKPELDTQN